MKKTLATILITTVALSFASISVAATGQGKSTYEAANERAAEDYKAATDQCKALAGNQKDVCMAEAKAVRTRAKAEAEAQYKNTPRARAAARSSIANAEFDVAKSKCAGQAGNAKDVCIAKAKTINVAAKADAKADKEVTTARADARDDKRDANYKLAIEKCDALTGTAKDECVAAAKTKYGK